MGEAEMRGLTGSAPSQVGVVGAMRARDVSRPSAEDLAAAAAAFDARPPADPRPRAGQPSAAGPPRVGSGGSTPESS